MAEQTEKTLTELTKWPREADGMTTDLMLRVIGCDTQRVWLEKWDDIDKGLNGREPMASPLYHARTQMIISAVGLMACIRALRKLDPAKADAFVKDYWTMCDAGDSFGELLWEFTYEAGLDPELIKLPEAAGATGKASA